jgi:elongation factor P
VKAQDLRPGVAVNLDGQLCIVTHFEHVKPGKGPAYAQVKLKKLDGGTVEKRFRTTEDVEQAVLDRREMEYLYTDSGGTVFMDSQTFDQVTVSDDLLGDARFYLKPNITITALVYEGNIVSIELPAAVDLEVTDTPPGIKGATATNQLKEATCETGLKTRVPPFVNVGDSIRVNTDTGEYISRAN